MGRAGVTGNTRCNGFLRECSSALSVRRRQETLNLQVSSEFTYSRVSRSLCGFKDSARNRNVTRNTHVIPTTVTLHRATTPLSVSPALSSKHVV